MIGIRNCSPWKTPAVFGNEDFGDGAVQTLEEILLLCSDKSKTYYIGGYSLSGLFSLGLPVRQICSPGLRQHRRLSGFRDL